MERLANRKKQGISGDLLRTWGLIFLASGVIGRGVLQNAVLGVGNASPEQLLAAISASREAMLLASVSLVLQAVETCALPIFALLLTEGMQHTKDVKAYFLRVLKLALLTEIPYNLAMNGSLFHLESRNPVFGLVLCMLMVALSGKFSSGKPGSKLIKALIALAAILWCEMLGVEFGTPLVLVTAILWALRGNTLYRNFAGAAAAMVCTLFSPFFLASPMGFLAVHFYDGEKGTCGRAFAYLAYPGMLLAAAAAGWLL